MKPTMSMCVNIADYQKKLIEYQKKRIIQLQDVAIAMRDWIDAVPSDTELPVMPGFDRDWVDEILAANDV